MKRRWGRRYGVYGDYASWDHALAASAPYETDLVSYGTITDRVRRGVATSGRNFLPILAGVSLLDEPAYILDFGGGLGMQYFEINHLIPSRIGRWCVVDKTSVVEHGRTKFADEKLSFFNSVEAAVDHQKPNLILASHTLQYLETPYAALKSLLANQPEVLILHELPLATRQRFMVQHLLPELGGGLRPVQLITEIALAEAVVGYEIVTEMSLPDWAHVKHARQVARLYRRRTK
jgi:putative methyltransferase (TIGR04325 family)